MVGGFCLVFHLLLSMHFFPSSKAHRRDLGSSAWPTYLPEDLGDENQGRRAHGYEPWPENHPQQLQQHPRETGLPISTFAGEEVNRFFGRPVDPFMEQINLNVVVKHIVLVARRGFA
jgi:hypothetical protein